MTTQEVTAENDIAVRYSCAAMPTDRSAQARFRLHVQDVLEAREMNQKDLRGANSEQWISNKMRGVRQITLNEAEEIAEALERPLSELIRRPEDQTYELDNLESRLIEAYRALSPDEQQAVVTVLTLRQRPAPLTAGEMLAAKRAKSTKGAAHGVSAAHRPAAAELPTYLQAIVDEFEGRLARAFGERSGEQAAKVGPPGPAVSPRGGKVRGPGARKT